MITRAVAVLGLLILVTAAFAGQDDTVDWSARGKAHFEAHRYDDAIDAFTRALHRHPADPDLFCWRAICFDFRGDFRYALADYAAGCAVAPDDPVPHYRRGELLYALQRYEVAERALTRAVQLNPQHGGAALYLGLIDMVMGRYEAAAGHFTTAAESTEETLAGRINLANIHHLTGRLEQADQLLRSVVADCDNGSFEFVVAATMRYFCLLKQDQGARGRKALLEAYELASPGGWAYPLLRCLNQDASAEETFAAYADDVQGLTMAHAVVGLDDLYSGRLDAAVTNLRWAVQRRTQAPFSTIALLEYRNLVAENFAPPDAVPATVYFEPDPVSAGSWGRLVAEYIPFPGQTTVRESWSIHSDGNSSPPLEKSFTITGTSHRQVIDFRVPEAIEAGVYRLQLEVARGEDVSRLVGDFEVR